MHFLPAELPNLVVEVRDTLIRETRRCDDWREVVRQRPPCGICEEVDLLAHFVCSFLNFHDSRMNSVKLKKWWYDLIPRRAVCLKGASKNPAQS